jgi:hypothetical protein
MYGYLRSMGQMVFTEGRETHGVPFLNAVNPAAPLTCRRVDQRTAHLRPARVAPAMVVVGQQS